MAKPEWGTKRTCPKCGERFYDLGKEDPVTCIACGEAWTPEPILKTKQPIVVEKEKEKEEEPESNDDEDIDLDDEDLDNVSLDDDDDDEVTAMVDTSLTDNED